MTTPIESCRSVAVAPGGAAESVAGLAGVAGVVAAAAVGLVGREVDADRTAVPLATGAREALAGLARLAAGAGVAAGSAVVVVPGEILADPAALDLEARAARAAGTTSSTVTAAAAGSGVASSSASTAGILAARAATTTAAVADGGFVAPPAFAASVVMTARSSRPRTAVGGAGFAVPVEARTLFGLRVDGCIVPAGHDGQRKNGREDGRDQPFNVLHCLLSFSAELSVLICPRSTVGKTASCFCLPHESILFIGPCLSGSSVAWPSPLTGGLVASICSLMANAPSGIRRRS